MPPTEPLQEKYESLQARFDSRSEPVIDPDYLLTFVYEYPGQEAEVVIDTQEFTAVCPWSGLPDFGALKITYVPDEACIELKSLKYYLTSYSGVDIVQEHAANRILNDLVKCCRPVRMDIVLDYSVRGGLHTTVTVRYERVS